jgi:hypothetical protein
MNTNVIFKRFNQEVMISLNDANNLLDTFGGGQITPEQLAKQGNNIYNVTKRTFEAAWDYAVHRESEKNFDSEIKFTWALNASHAGAVNCYCSLKKNMPVGYVKTSAEGFEAHAYLYKEGYGTPCEELQKGFKDEKEARSWVIQEALKLIMNHEPELIF